MFSLLNQAWQLKHILLSEADLVFCSMFSLVMFGEA